METKPKMGHKLSPCLVLCEGTSGAEGWEDVLTSLLIYYPRESANERDEDRAVGISATVLHI